MELPYSKIIIYSLTMVTYVWSGYGSSVITHFRDAVLAAEGFFGDFLVKVNDVVNKINNARDTFDSTIDEVCKWQCPYGGKAVQNKYHKPVANGCGPEGMQIASDQFPSPDMTQCCNEHDICYGTCNNDKDKCDIDFRRCLYKICEDIKIKADDLANKGCKAAAKVLFTATTTLGCSFYKKAQEEACYCHLPKKRKYPGDEL